MTPHRKNNNTAVSDARPSRSQKWLFWEIRQLGSPTNVVSAPSSQPLPTDHRPPRPSIACVRAQAAAAAAAGLAQCDATDGCAALRSLMRQRLSLPAALCVCCTSRPSPATKYRSIVFSPSVSPFLPSPLLPTRQTHSLPYTQKPHTHITMSTRSTRKRKNEEEELVELPEDSDAESEEE